MEVGTAVVAERFKRLADALGMSGAWLEVGKLAIQHRTIRIAPGYYFLAWDDRAIMWEEGPQGPDSRIPPRAWWLWAWKIVWDRQDPEPLSSPEYAACRAGQKFPHREALLRTAGFHRCDGQLGLMELMPTPAPWKERGGKFD